MPIETGEIFKQNVIILTSLVYRRAKLFAKILVATFRIPTKLTDTSLIS